MKTLTFANGDQMPVIGLGTWKSKPGDVYQAVTDALAMGYRHIDCAAIYGNEAEIGLALNAAFTAGVVSREELWITSKLWCDSFAPEDIEPALRQTLTDLQLEYLDLYLLHWPIPLKKGHGMRTAEDFVDPQQQPVSSTWAALEPLQVQGLVRHIGVSNFTATKLKALAATAKQPPELNQVELHPYLQQPALREYCDQHEILLTGYSPLGSADRPDPLKQADEPVLLQDAVIAGIAQELGCSQAQVILSWAVAQGLSVIPKSVTPARMQENLAAVRVELSPEQLSRIADLDRNRRYITGEFWIKEGGYYSLSDIWD